MTRAQSNSIPLFLFFITVSALFMIVTVNPRFNEGSLTITTLTNAELLSLYPEPTIPELSMATKHVSEHGLTKHPEAAAIEEACNKSIYQVWRDKYERKYYYLCKTEDGKWGLIPVIISNGVEIWKTAFSPGSGIWGDAVQYLTNTATRYNGAVK
jgi:hypothetical protein